MQAYGDDDNYGNRYGDDEDQVIGQNDMTMMSGKGLNATGMMTTKRRQS